MRVGLRSASSSHWLTCNVNRPVVWSTINSQSQMPIGGCVIGNHLRTMTHRYNPTGEKTETKNVISVPLMWCRTWCCAFGTWQISCHPYETLEHQHFVGNSVLHNGNRPNLAYVWSAEISVWLFLICFNNRILWRTQGDTRILKTTNLTKSEGI